MIGLARTSGVAASLLLTIETPATVFIAWAFFREPLGARVIVGGVLIVGGSLALRLTGGAGGDTSLLGAAAIVGSCVGWALDNNATARIADRDAIWIACFKCVCAAPFALALAWLVEGDRAGAGSWDVLSILETLVTGLVGYGLSLASFVRALREIGAARTGALFASAPFLSAIVAVPLLRERPGAATLIAGALLAAGTWLIVSERTVDPDAKP
jgi:drug/metabolite transporter (DMT)-like permease